jgi:hypothetical protein
MKVGMELNTKESKGMLVSRHQNAGKDADNRSFVNVAKFKRLGTTLKSRMKELKQIKLGECLLSFSSESSIFLPDI